MPHIKMTSLESRRSIIGPFIIFMIITALLFVGVTLAVLIPKIDKTFDNMHGVSEKTTAKVFAGQLKQYIRDRELALKDIAVNSLITNTVLLADGDNPAFRDFVKSTTLLGEDPEITVIDAVGDIIYQEVNNESMKPSDYQWALSLLDIQTHEALLNIANNTKSQFELAIPIFYGKRSEGILIARITADPKNLFTEDSKLDDSSSVAYEKNGRRITSEARDFKVIHNEEVDIVRYGLSFIYTSDYTLVLEKKTEIVQSFIFVTLFGALVIVSILSIFGRHFIIKPVQALAASRQAIASAVEGISHIDTQGRYITLNNAYAQIVGYLPEDLEGEIWSKTVYPEDLPALNIAYQQMLKEGKVSVEARGIKKDGTIFHKRVTMISQYSERGVFIGHNCFMQDITLQKMTEEKIRKQQQDLQLIFDNVPVSIWYKDDKNRILRLNKHAAEAMGGNVEDFEGKDTYDLFPAMAKKYHDDDLAVMRSNISQLSIVEEFAPIGKPRSWVSTDKIPYTDPITQESFIFVCAQDITPIKNAELEKNQLIDELSYTNKELEQFAYIASHDLKAPLRGIEQLASWIQQDCTDLLPEDSAKHLTLMVNRVQRMGKLLDDLLAYSQVTRIDLSQEHIELRSVLNDLLDLHVQAFGFEYTLNVPEGTVLIARKPFEIIIRNLLDNAVKHHDKSKGHITITYEKTANAHVFEIKDDGPGIDPELHDRAFKMFQTLKSRDKVEGSGMGLAIIKKILYRYKGSIDIHSDGHNGTTFNIIWPCDILENEVSL